MSNVYLNAKINSFVTQKLATMGDAVSSKVTKATKARTTSGIYYEFTKIPKRQK